jgi:hypothetical protein
VTAGRAAAAVTLLLIWTVLATFVWPILRDDRHAARRKRQGRRQVEQLTPAQPWQGAIAPSVRVLPASTAAASSIPRLAAAPAVTPTQRRIS